MTRKNIEYIFYKGSSSVSLLLLLKLPTEDKGGEVSIVLPCLSVLGDIQCGKHKRLDFSCNSPFHGYYLSFVLQYSPTWM